MRRAWRIHSEIEQMETGDDGGLNLPRPYRLLVVRLSIEVGV
jgi:hypothetical protein